MAEPQSPLIENIEVMAHDLEQPPVDTRTYRVVELPNKLEALLDPDTGTDKAPSAMDVNMGSFNDSEYIPGMAHAVEHPLFLGTKKVSIACSGENSTNRWPYSIQQRTVTTHT
jgi:insulysin